MVVNTDGQVCRGSQSKRFPIREPVRAVAPLEWVLAKPIVDGFACVVPNNLLNSVTHAVRPRAARVFALSNVRDLRVITQKRIVRMDALLSWFRRAVLHQLSVEENERLLLLHAWLVARKVMMGRSTSVVQTAPQISSCSDSCLVGNQAMRPR